MTDHAIEPKPDLAKSIREIAIEYEVENLLRNKGHVGTWPRDRFEGVLDAALEDTGMDVTAESYREQILAEAEARAAKFSTNKQPMRDPVAPPGRVCATCRWWGTNMQVFGYEQMLICPKLAGIVRIVGETVWTPSDFGCNHWQPKDATS